MTEKSQNLLRLLDDFINLKIEGILNPRDVELLRNVEILRLLRNEALNYADNVDDYWPDHEVNVTFKPALKDEI